MAKDSFSFSKVQTFTKCSQMYHLHYTSGLYRTDSSNATFTGSMVHEALEAYYLGEEEHPYPALQKAWAKFFKDNELETLIDRIQDINSDMAQLIWRASAECKDPKVWIRNKDGTVPKALSYNRTYQNECARLGIEERKAYVDTQVQRKLPELAGVSICDCYTDSLELLKDYEEIPGLTEVKYVELPFSKKEKAEDGSWETSNAVELPELGDYINGFIDLVAVVNDKIAIIDHKTSSGPAPDILAVMYWDQLLLYAYAYEKLFGEKPYYVGINHVRSKKTILAPINWDIVNDAVARLEATITAAKAGVPFKRSPTEYNSPCTGGAKQIAEYTRPCKYLDICHPELHQILKGE